MASVTARLSVLGDNLYGDQEKDANSLLMELDKGLRSGKVGEQCEAIVRFPRLFEKYPFPILINSSFLKVADVFRVGSNFLRLCILQVTEQSEKHLEKIISVDEFVRRIYVVLHSNDPVARALTLRTLGSVACIISDRKNVHHSILNSLDSHDRVELEAAISAASAFASRSESFVNSISDKLAEMVECLSIPAFLKLRIILVFEKMNCNLETSQKVRSLCIEMLHCHPSCKFVLTILHTLTRLSVRSIVAIPSQMELLLDYLSQDIRHSVKMSCLKNLKILAQNAPHMWTDSNVMALCDFLNGTTCEDLQIQVLNVLSVLLKTRGIVQMSPETNLQMIDCCTKFCYHDNTKIGLKAAEMFVDIVIHSLNDRALQSQQTSSVLLDNVCIVLETNLIMLVDGKSEDGLLSCLKLITTLCQSSLVTAERFVIAVADILEVCPEDSCLIQLLCECLSAIGGLQSGLLPGITQNILRVLGKILSSDDNSNNKKRATNMLFLVRLLLQGSVEDGLDAEMLEMIKRVLDVIDGWTVYKIGRQAGRYGHHALAADIFEKLTTQISTEHYYFWLSTFKDCCLGESCLQMQSPATSRLMFVEQMLKAESHYHKAIIAVKAAATPNYPLIFQTEYLQLRAKMIQSFVLVIQACCSFQTSPPPAIATSLTMTTGLEQHRCEHVLIQLKKCSQKFKDVEEKYQALYQSSFDADLSTLANLEMLLERCRLMIYVLDTILLQTQGVERKLDRWITSMVKQDTEDDSRLELILWKSIKRQVQEMIQKSLERDSPFPLTHQNIDCIEKTALLVGRWRQCLPRFMFQRLQTTDIKLAISPSSRAPGEPILINSNIHLTLKVEGVIQTGSQRKRFHHVDKVQLLVYSQLQNRTATVNDAKIEENPTNRMIETTKAHNDYFMTRFILSFPVSGLHLVIVEASVIDKDGDIWKTGPKTTVLVKSYDEGQHKKQQVHFASQQSQLSLPSSSSLSSLARPLGGRGVQKME